ncbi:SDR family oxidoreductase [Myxococcota bacterium]|nr:SDR family oxidoreductase [Myxococcota bacterium]
MRSLRDRVVVVTGAGSGLGRAIALAFGRKGCRVHGLELDPERAEDLGREGAREGLRVAGHPADCTDPAALSAAIRDIRDREGRVDVLVANAGTVVSGLAETLPGEDWEHILDLNYRAVVLAVRAVLPAMVHRGEGHLVLVSSMAGLLPLPTVAPYCATKAATAMLGETLAVETVGTGVGVTTVCTGSLRTRVLEDGRLRLPDGIASGLRRAMAWGSGSPDALARRIVRAVRWNRPYVFAPRELWPLWLLRRLSFRLYLAVLRLVFRHPLKSLRKAVAVPEETDDERPSLER